MNHMRNRYTAEYLYPGSFFPESIHREIDAPTLQAAIAAAPQETEGTYFVKDGWYAVEIFTITEKRFVADDGEETWIKQGKPEKHTAIVGHLVHIDSIPDDDEHRILRSNVRSNSREPWVGYAVKTRAGNWQVASDWDEVVSL